MRKECEHHHTPARDNQYRATARYYVDNCPYCRIDELEQQLTDEQQDCADLALQVAKLEQQLSRYQGGVEVEGDFWVNGLFNCTIHIRDDFGKLDNVPAGCRVRVLVMEVL